MVASQAQRPDSALPEPPFSTRLIADFHAGALDEATTNHVRGRLAADPQAAHTLGALDQVQSDLHEYGQSSAPMPDDIALRLDNVIDGLT